MRETWLRTNRRILGLGMIFPAVGLAVGVWLLWLKSPAWQIGLTVIGFSAVAIALLAWQMVVPKLAGDGGDLLIFLRPDHRFGCRRNLLNVFSSVAELANLRPRMGMCRFVIW